MTQLKQAGRVRAAMAALLAGTAFSTGAVAQAQVMDVVTVTSERRETAIQDTPLSVLAFTPETIERQGIEDLMDVSLFTPNLTISGSRGNGVNQPTYMIRGISGGGGATSERGVALYLDGIYVPRTNGSIFNVLDVDRIEVLRGPQGTLFGRNSTGGAIRMFTKQPGPEQESYARVTVGEMDRTDFVAMTNIPVSERFFVRLQGGLLKEEGWVTRGTQELGGHEDWVGRFQAKALLSDTLTANFGFLYSDSQSDGSPQDVETFDMAPGIEGFFDGNFADWLSDALEADGQAPIAAVDDPRIVRDDFTMPDFCLLDDFDPDFDAACELFNDSVYWQADLNLTWDLGDNLSLISTSGAAEMDHEGLTSWQQLGFEARPDNVNSEVFYQDLQLNAGLFGGRVELVTGVNFFYEDSSSSGALITRRGTSAPPGPPTWANDPDGDGVPGRANGNGDAGLFTTDDTLTRQESTSWGWFNSAIWHITDATNLTVGARLAHDKKEYMQTEYASDNFNPAPGTSSTTVTTDDSWTEVDWRATLDHHFTEDVMGYATVSKAYQAGQFSFGIIDLIPGDLQSGDFIQAIPPEKVVNYEAGLRTEFGGRFRLNPTLFFMQWSNRQAARQITCTAAEQASGACPVGFVIRVVDSGDVDVYGAEIDGQFFLTDQFSIYGAYGYTNYELADPVANSGPYLFPEPPMNTGNIGALYTMPMDGGAEMNFSVNYAYVGSQQTHPTDDSDSTYEQPDYGLVNARVEWKSGDGRYTLALFANNLLDETYASYSTRFGGGYWDFGGPRRGAGIPDRSSLNVVRGKPRQIGATLQVNF